MALVMTVFLATGLNGCVSVASYQKMYINDQDMQLGPQKIQYFENNIHAYREGAVGGNGGKTGGGCGCN